MRRQTIALDLKSDKGGVMLHRCPFSDERRLINFMIDEVVLLPAGMGVEMEVADEGFAIVECIEPEGAPQWCFDMFGRLVCSGSYGRRCYLQYISERQAPRWLGEESLDWDLHELPLRAPPWRVVLP